MCSTRSGGAGRWSGSSCRPSHRRTGSRRRPEREPDGGRGHRPGPERRARPGPRLTVLYDAQCSLCTHLRDWLVKQQQLVPLQLVPAASDEARRRFPGLDHGATLDEITVVGDGGQVYRGSAAFVVCLWTLREQRQLAHRLSTPAGARLAKGAMLAAAKWRRTQATEGWGGGVYRRGDGWAYEPSAGWTYTAPACDGDTCATR